MRTLKKMLFLSFALSLAAGCAGGRMMTHEPTLYERLGGKPAIEAVVEDFVSRLAADMRISNARVAARFSTTHVPSLKMHLVNQICEAAGGPCKYTGRDMQSAHAGLEITMAEFNAVVDDLVAALNKFKVPEKEKNELLSVLGPMNKEIVQKP